MLIPAFISHITGKDVLKFAFLPQITPRIKNLFEEGFSNLAFFMVLIYQAVRLLPANHPYLSAGANGSYSIRDVLTEASKNLRFELKYIDQIIIYFALVAGIAILCIQFLLLVTAIFVSPARAQAEAPTGFGEFFTNTNTTDDIAFRMLDSVFGIPNLFNSQEPTETAFHTALHGLFQFYSIGLLILGAILVIYYIFVVFAETAQTGTPFGKRFNHAWVPIRLVVAFGLLIPISFGLNSSQWVTLYAAKLGSNFATNGWNTFYQTLNDENTLGEDDPIAQPNLPDLRDLAAFMTIAKTCRELYSSETQENGVVKAKYKNIEHRDIRAYVIHPTEPDPSKQFYGTYESDAEYANYTSINIRFGEKDSDEYAKQTGNVYPYCGDLSIIVPEPIKDSGPHASEISPVNKINKSYYRLIHQMWTTNFAGMDEPIAQFVEANVGSEDGALLNESLKNSITQAQREYLLPKITEAVEEAIEQFREENGEEYLRYGWGGAGIFYNDIANINGRVTNAIMNVPQIRNYPAAMEFVCKQNTRGREAVREKDCYNPKLPREQRIDFTEAEVGLVAKTLSGAHNYWYKDGLDDTGNSLVNVINLLFGTQGLFDMCKNADVHPLAQLATLGKGLVEVAIRNIGVGVGLAIGSVIPVIGPTAGAVSKMAMSFAGIGILIGFILYYIIPFLPFLYFLFAVGGWIKGIFEAMVGVPLWALAHIRIDGQGLPGDGAINGYFLIFEIFIRPILIVFGLIAAVLIFGAMVKVLNDIFGIVITNISGNDPSLGEACFQRTGNEEQDAAAAAQAREGVVEYVRGPIDEFFYTIVYAILVYLIAMASFKLIDLIPNSILRWMGQGVQTFNDQAGEPAEGLLQKIAVGGGLIGGQIQGAASQAGDGLSKTLGAFTQNKGS